MVDGAADGPVLIRSAVDIAYGGSDAGGERLQAAVVGGDGTAGVAICWSWLVEFESLREGKGLQGEHTGHEELGVGVDVDV